MKLALYFIVVLTKVDETVMLTHRGGHIDPPLVAYGVGALLERIIIGAAG